MLRSAGFRCSAGRNASNTIACMFAITRRSNTRSMIVDEFGIGPLGPAPWCLILLAGEDADGHGDGDAFDVEKPALVFPVKTRRGYPGVCQPIKCDVVEDLVTRQFARGT